MTKQANVADKHIISPVMGPEENLINRLEYINIYPEYILLEGIETDKIKNKFNKARLIKDERADLILSVIRFDGSEIDLEKIFLNWRKKIKPEGMILFVLVKVELDILELGDYLAGMGFVNVVTDSEENNIYGHMLGPKEINIRLDQIKIRSQGS